jgi:hypothetical protein
VNGLWTMKIQTNTWKTAFGVAVFANGKILGGDSGHYYAGTYSLQGETLTGEVKVTSYSGVISSLFGSSAATIKVKGKTEGTAFLLSGHMAQQPSVTVTIKGNKRDACLG